MIFCVKKKRCEHCWNEAKIEETAGKVCKRYVVPKAMKKFYFLLIQQYVNIHIRNCLECIHAKHKTGEQAGKLHPISPSERPFAVVHADRLSQLQTLIDTLTKYVYAVPVKDVKAKTTVNKCQKYVAVFGILKRLITDHGTIFTVFKHTLNSSCDR